MNVASAFSHGVASSSRSAIVPATANILGVEADEAEDPCRSDSFAANARQV